jgi:hypothetical protein
MKLLLILVSILIIINRCRLLLLRMMRQNVAQDEPLIIETVSRETTANIIIIISVETLD